MTGPPRGRPARIALAGLLGLVLLMSSVVPKTFVEDATGSKYLGWLAAGILPGLAGVWLTPRIAYRRRDALVLLTMGPSALPSAFLFIKLIWRIAYLPHRDWPLRGEGVTEPAPASPPPTPAAAPRPSWSRDVTGG